MEKRCYEYETDRIVTADGQKEKKIICFCGTTVCQKLVKKERDISRILKPEVKNLLLRKAAEIEKEINRVFDYNSLDKNKILEIIRQILKGSY